jgi:hypothetical protein
MHDVTWDNQMDQQDGMVRWYNQRAQPKSFTIGDQVLALMPDGLAKLKTQWHGPYTVVAQVSPVTHQIDMPDKRKRHHTLHVNMLKEWNPPTATVLAVGVVELEGTTEEEHEQEGDHSRDQRPGPAIASRLDAAQRDSYSSFWTRHPRRVGTDWNCRASD